MLIRRKVFTAASLTLDDAVDNMELVGHDFYLFVDKETKAPSVVYRRGGMDLRGDLPGPDLRTRTSPAGSTDPRLPFRG